MLKFIIISIVLALGLACGSSSSSSSDSIINITSTDTESFVKDDILSSLTISKPEGNVIFHEDVNIPSDIKVIVESKTFQISGNLKLSGELEIK